MIADESEDDALDPTLLEAARDYNAPPATVPREAMWSAIQAARAGAARPDARSATDTIPIGTRSRRGWSWRSPWPVAIAAGIVLAAGIAIGRWTHPPASPTIAVAPPQVTRAPGGSAPTDGAAYQVAVAHDLTQAEALLTAYRSEHQPSIEHRGRAEVASWARDVLSNTRLLLDSPAAADPKQRRLLEDLELVLVQMVELAPEGSGTERQMIDSTLEHDHVLSRLRYAVPAGATGI
jgi:hypothetical protein